MSQTQKVLELGGRKITLVGTAHVSAQSINEVTNTIMAIKPDCVAVELDEKRADSIQNGQKFSELDIVKVIREGKVFLVLANLILSSFQKRMGQNIGVKPGNGNSYHNGRPSCSGNLTPRLGKKQLFWKNGTSCFSFSKRLLQRRS